MSTAVSWVWEIFMLTLFNVVDHPEKEPADWKRSVLYKNVNRDKRTSAKNFLSIYQAEMISSQYQAVARLEKGVYKGKRTEMTEKDWNSKQIPDHFDNSFRADKIHETDRNAKQQPCRFDH